MLHGLRVGAVRAFRMGRPIRAFRHGAAFIWAQVRGNDRRIVALLVNRARVWRVVGRGSDLDRPHAANIWHGLLGVRIHVVRALWHMNGRELGIISCTVPRARLVGGQLGITARASFHGRGVAS